MSYCADKNLVTDGRTDGRTDEQTQATTIPGGQNWPRVKMVYSCLNFLSLKNDTVPVTLYILPSHTPSFLRMPISSYRQLNDALWQHIPCTGCNWKLMQKSLVFTKYLYIINDDVSFQNLLGLWNMIFLVFPQRHIRSNFNNENDKWNKRNTN